MHNPMRRSRKIGLTQGGRVRDGRAAEKWSRVFSRDIWEKLSIHRRDQGVRVLEENPSGAFYHPCQGHEYLSVLERLPAQLRQPVRAIVLRRTPKLDARLGVEARMRFGCVILNAFPRSDEIDLDGSAVPGRAPALWPLVLAMGRRCGCFQAPVDHRRDPPLLSIPHIFA